VGRGGGSLYWTSCIWVVGFGLYKIFVDFEAVVHESTILSSPPPTCIAHPGTIRLRNHWTVYDSPSDLLRVCYIPLVVTISCKGEGRVEYRHGFTPYPIPHPTSLIPLAPLRWNRLTASPPYPPSAQKRMPLPYLTTLRVEYAERGKSYGILFIFSLFCEYGNFEYVHIHVIYRVNQAEYVIYFLLFAPQEYVNTYSTRRLTTHMYEVLFTCLPPERHTYIDR